MRDIAIIIHFIGLAMGLGTSLAYMFLGIASSKMEKAEALKFHLAALPLGRMGHIGLALLILSGGYLMTPYWSSLGNMPLMVFKLVLVGILTLLIVLISMAGNKAKKGDAEKHLKKTELFGKMALFTALAIVVLAVYNFE